MTRMVSWGFEGMFVITALILLKLWLFPFFIFLWFHEVLPIPDWTMIVFGIVTCFIYMGLGSTSKNIYGLPLIGSLLGFLLIHSVLFLPASFMKEAFLTWKGLLLDVLFLFFPQKTFSVLTLFLAYFGCFLLGRRFHVKENVEENIERKQRINIPL